MPVVSDELKGQIEAAFDFRGHVTVHLRDGEPVVGYLYNRDLAAAEPFVELYLKGDGASEKLAVARIERIELTGKDHAAYG